MRLQIWRETKRKKEKLGERTREDEDEEKE